MYPEAQTFNLFHARPLYIIRSPFVALRPGSSFLNVLGLIVVV